ncbi:hypothetical protein [Allochromatium palmeri]|uniref:Sodium/calcium exchanger membrane region domain-containing protein n=1 Tax=Allochromatium palmeri TaxID=231048 RepID=A0A6N8EBR5_9GAMM|nr:hypothetical protein [Allochromatium palmeri]MTW20940.1 hypothetical protein [Allochromatium palmeri]
MPDWLLSLAVLIPGLVGLILGVALLCGAITVSARATGGARRWPSAPVFALLMNLPALAVLLQAVGSGASRMALGVIVGGHLLGVLLTIGAVSPSCSASRQDRPRAQRLLGASVGVWVLMLDGGIARIEGGGLILLCLLYLAWSARCCRDDATGIALFQPVLGLGRCWRRISRALVGLTVLSLGAQLLAMGALDLAFVLELDRWTIGLTLVVPASLGSSWLAMVTRRPRQADASVIGPSRWLDFSLVNLLGLTGLVALATPGGLDLTRETVQVSWLLVILSALLVWLSLVRDDEG